MSRLEGHDLEYKLFTDAFYRARHVAWEHPITQRERDLTTILTRAIWAKEPAADITLYQEALETQQRADAKVFKTNPQAVIDDRDASVRVAIQERDALDAALKAIFRKQK